MPGMVPLPAVLLSILFAAIIYGPSAASASPVASLGVASGFAVLAGTTVTNPDSSIVNGDLG